MKTFNAKFEKILELATGLDEEFVQNLNILVNSITEDQRKLCQKGMPFEDEKYWASFNNEEGYNNETVIYRANLKKEFTNRTYDLKILNLLKEDIDKLETYEDVSDAIIFDTSCPKDKVPLLNLINFNVATKGDLETSYYKEHRMDLIKSSEDYVLRYTRMKAAYGNHDGFEIDVIVPISHEELVAIANLDCPQIDENGYSIT